MKSKDNLDKTYFKAGQDWYFERYESLRVQSNRWFVAFLASGSLAILLTIVLIILMPLKTLVPLVVHQNTTTGEVWIDRPKTRYTPINDAQVESDIVRYITARESYSAMDLNQRFHLVMLLSAGNVGNQYANEQANGNKSAPVNLLGTEGTRTIKIEDIVFIDKANTQQLRHFKQPSQNLAKVDFTTTVTDPAGNKKSEAWVATIGWVYRGMPADQQEAWDNWNGFTVITYRVDPRHVGQPNNS